MYDHLCLIYLVKSVMCSIVVFVCQRVCQSFPIKNGGSFHSYGTVYRRTSMNHWWIKHGKWRIHHGSSWYSQLWSSIFSVPLPRLYRYMFKVIDIGEYISTNVVKTIINDPWLGMVTIPALYGGWGDGKHGIVLTTLLIYRDLTINNHYPLVN